MWDYEEYVPEDTGVLSPENREDAQRVNQRCSDAFYAFSCFIEHRLKKAKLRLGEQNISIIGIRLSSTPAPRPEIYLKVSIWIDILQNPREFLALEATNEVFGELGIRIVNEAADKLLNLTTLPNEDLDAVSSLLKEASEEFRAQGYVTHFCAANRTIPNTKLKGRIDVYMDAEKTVRTITILYRGKELFTREIGRVAFIDNLFAVEFYDFSLSGSVLTFHSQEPDYLEWLRKSPKKIDLEPMIRPYEIDLRDDEATYLLMKEKGWLTA